MKSEDWTVNDETLLVEPPHNLVQEGQLVFDVRRGHDVI